MDKDKELRKQELKKKIELLTADYFFTIYANDGEEIGKTFHEYFQLTKDEKEIDKEVVGYAMDILLSFNREYDDLGENIQDKALDMALYLVTAMAHWCVDNAALIVKSPKACHWETLEELDEILQKLKAN